MGMEVGGVDNKSFISTQVKSKAETRPDRIDMKNSKIFPSIDPENLSILKPETK